MPHKNGKNATKASASSKNKKKPQSEEIRDAYRLKRDVKLKEKIEAQCATVPRISPGSINAI